MNIPTILISDDEPEQLANIKNYLGLRIKVNFLEASNGAEAIEKIKHNKCDMIILDIRMPNVSGMEVLEFVKDMPIFKIVFTVWDSEQVFEECRARGMNDYIAKGGSLVEFYEKVAKCLKSRDQFFPIC